MVKADLIRKVSARTGVPKTVVSNIVEVTLSEIIDGVLNDRAVILRGFGTFSFKKERARTGRNFSSGQSMEIPERVVPVFEPSTSFKEYVRESEQC